MQKTDNEVIAEFMGLAPAGHIRGEDNSFVQMGWYDPRTELDEADRFNFGRMLHVRELMYHECWRWLMPVWYKFWELQIVSFDDHDTWITHCGKIIDAIAFKGPSPSEASRLLAEGIRWYNSIQK